MAKTTQSGWAGFLQDEYTTLAPTSERILATTLSGSWTYGAAAGDDDDGDYADTDFAGAHAGVRAACLGALFGDAEAGGTFSRGVQHSLFLMATAVLRAVPIVARVHLSLPNLHFVPCQLPVFERLGLRFEDDVYIPSDAPHGTISATVERDAEGAADSCSTDVDSKNGNGALR